MSISTHTIYLSVSYYQFSIRSNSSNPWDYVEKFWRTTEESERGIATDRGIVVVRTEDPSNVTVHLLVKETGSPDINYSNWDYIVDTSISIGNSISVESFPPDADEPEFTLALVSGDYRIRIYHSYRKEVNDRDEYFLAIWPALFSSTVTWLINPR